MALRLLARTALPALAVLAVVAASRPARADLGEDAARVARIWAERGAKVERLPPIFAERGHPRRLTLPTLVPGDPGCLTLALLAVRTAELTVDPAPAGATTPSPASPEAGEGSRRRSAGGVATIARCGAARAQIGQVVVELSSARAAVELILARSDGPVAAPGEILPERATGPVAPRGDTGGPMEPGPIAERVGRAERRARADGAAEVTRSVVRASANGAGQAELPLEAGCHRLDVMAEVPSVFPHRATDVDADARDATGKILARDRADVPDARLDFCLGVAAPVTVPFTGAAGAVPVTFSDARWPLPGHLPARWGSRARGGFAAALFRHRVPDPQGDPILVSLGAPGTTVVSLAIPPGRCYLASLAVIHGDARSIRLTATLGDHVARDDATGWTEGAALSFCAESEAVARFDAEVRGTGVWWALAVWPMGSAAE